MNARRYKSFNGKSWRQTGPLQMQEHFYILCLAKKQREKKLWILQCSLWWTALVGTAVSSFSFENRHWTNLQWKLHKTWRTTLMDKWNLWRVLLLSAASKPSVIFAEYIHNHITFYMWVNYEVYLRHFCVNEN